jgi:cobalamin biosynthesis Co2+ chelatase CbiK
MNETLFYIITIIPKQGGKHKMPTHKRIALIGFGDLSVLAAEVRDAFPQCNVSCARDLSEIQGNCDLVQPIYLLPGIEYEKLCQKARNRHIPVGKPILHSEESIRKLAEILTQEYPQGNILYIGHGTKHAASAAYTALGGAMGANAAVGTLDEIPTIDSTIKERTLVPLLLSVGRHMEHEILGDLRETLEKTGIKVCGVRRGLLDYPAVRRMIINAMNNK